MITICTIPAAHEGHTATIQLNAIRSWSKLAKCSVMLFGDDSGVAELAVSLGVRHVPDIKRNDLGTPLVSWAFAEAQRLSQDALIAYVNADIILLDDFVSSAERILRDGLEKFLVVGQRYDLDVKENLEFGPEWQQDLRQRVAESGVLHGKSGMDYFLFKRGAFPRLPDFAIGRPGWDGWLIYNARSSGTAVVNATESILAVHQNHPPRYKVAGTEATQNFQIAGGFRKLGSLRDANWNLTSQDLKPLDLWRRVLSSLMLSSLGRAALGTKRLFQYWRARARNS